MVEENEIVRLRNELSKSRKRLIVAIFLIGILSGGWFITYVVLEIALNLAESQAEKSKFEFYYASRCKQRYGVDDLEEYLDRWGWAESAYTRGVFDCSEMSTYIEWRLENEGYNTIIAVGQSPSNPEARHAWLLVETSEDKYMPVEATQYTLVKWNSPYFDSYFEYDHSFETIFDALDHDYDSFNWWGS